MKTYLISIILPVFNEEKNLPVIYQELNEIVRALPAHYEFEFILVNDGSVDSSWHVITGLAQHDERIRALSFSRNFGHQIALKAGYDNAYGDAVITMDTDLQDPPSLIVQMIHEWQRGAEIVYARRLNRKDSLMKRSIAYVYYKLLDAVADVHIPRNVGDFRLVDKKVVTVVKNCHERSYYLRGLVAWTGFKHTFVDFNRQKRHDGCSGYTWTKMFKLAFDGITGFSLFPLKIAAYVGVFVIVSGSAMFAYITFDALLHDVYYPLFKWLVTAMYIFMGVQFLLMWLIGEYIGRTYDLQKNRPAYIVAQIITPLTKDKKYDGMPLPVASVACSWIHQNRGQSADRL